MRNTLTWGDLWFPRSCRNHVVVLQTLRSWRWSHNSPTTSEHRIDHLPPWVRLQNQFISAWDVSSLCSPCFLVLFPEDQATQEDAWSDGRVSAWKCQVHFGDRSQSHRGAGVESVWWGARASCEHCIWYWRGRRRHGRFRNSPSPRGPRDHPWDPTYHQLPYERSNHWSVQCVRPRPPPWQCDSVHGKGRLHLLQTVHGCSVTLDLVERALCFGMRCWWSEIWILWWLLFCLAVLCVWHNLLFLDITFGPFCGDSVNADCLQMGDWPRGPLGSTPVLGHRPLRCRNVFRRPFSSPSVRGLESRSFRFLTTLASSSRCQCNSWPGPIVVSVL